MEMVRSQGWDRKEGQKYENEDEGGALRRGRTKMVGFGKWRIKPETGLVNVEWIVIDEPDVFFGVYEHSFWFSYTNFLRSRIPKKRLPVEHQSYS